MGIGVSIFLLALGAVLTFALTENELGPLALDTVGVILMIAGAIGLAITIALLSRDRRAVPPARGAVVEYRITRERDVY